MLRSTSLPEGGPSLQCCEEQKGDGVVTGKVPKDGAPGVAQHGPCSGGDPTGPPLAHLHTQPGFLADHWLFFWQAMAFCPTSSKAGWHSNLRVSPWRKRVPSLWP